MGSDALRMRRRITRYSDKDITPDSTGDTNQDPAGKNKTSVMLWILTVLNIHTVTSRDMAVYGLVGGY
jgi:hypothetical protein